jgi:hypothetical protein|nr:MAG TPA: hypothetical protein [Caudoviricetes sp.]
MEELLIKTIKEMGYPIIKQGSLSEDENYPETFFTFWNNTSDDGSHYDNESNTYIWDFDLNVYSSDPEKINKLLLDAKEKLIKKEFIVNGKGHDLISDEPTHTGRGINVQIIEK